MKYLIIMTIWVFSCIKESFFLECYVCNEQDKNDEKCLKTIKTCEADQDMCLTEIKWGTTPYWQAGAQKQFYVSKRCASKHQCERTMRKYMLTCTHVWYEDWKCAECCGGDKCNYYVISASNKMMGFTTLVLSSLLGFASYLYAI